MEFARQPATPASTPTTSPPALRIAVAALALGFTVSAFAADPAATTELTSAQIVAKNVAARGGLDAWRKIESMVLLGHVESADAPMPNMQFMLEQKRPNKSRFEIKAMDQTSVRAFDGTRGWKSHPPRSGEPAVQPYTSDEVRFARETFGIEGPLIDHEAKGLAVTLDGVDQVGGRKTYRLNVRPPFGASHHVWIDAETFLEAKADRSSRNLSGLTARVTVYYRDYKTVEGLQIPGVIETGIGSAKPTDRMVIERVSLNPPLDDRIFARPTAMSTRRSSLWVRSGAPQSVQGAPRPTN